MFSLGVIRSRGLGGGGRGQSPPTPKRPFHADRQERQFYVKPISSSSSTASGCPQRQRKSSSCPAPASSLPPCASGAPSGRGFPFPPPSPQKSLCQQTPGPDGGGVRGREGSGSGWKSSARQPASGSPSLASCSSPSRGLSQKGALTQRSLLLYCPHFPSPGALRRFPHLGMAVAAAGQR